MPYEIRHTLLRAWFEQHVTMNRDGAADLGALKSTLICRGVNSRGWRLYLDYGDALFERLGRPWVAADWLYSSGQNALAFLRLLQSCETDVLPPPALISSMSGWGIPKDRLALVPPGFFRSAWKACVAAEYAGVPVATFVEADVAPLSRWFFSTGQYVDPDANRLKAGWSALERRYLEWLRAIPPVAAVRDRTPSAPPAEWPAPVRAVEYEGLRFVSLSTAGALQEEGRAMRHCIGNYVRRCFGSSLRAYSVRHIKSGERLATLTVSYVVAHDHWTLDEIKGPENADVDQRIVRAAYGLLRSLDDATAEDHAFRQFLRRIQSRADEEGREIDEDCFYCQV